MPSHPSDRKKKFNPKTMHALHIPSIVKEEGDASQTNQAFDQQVAKCDKRSGRHLLQALRQANQKHGSIRSKK